MRNLYLLDPAWTHLNHGSFGACPRPVFEEYQRLQRELERQPTEFFRQVPDAIAGARAELAPYVGADPDGLLFMQNVTVGVNAIAHSLRLGPGDEVLSTDHEYGSNREPSAGCRGSGQKSGRAAATVPPSKRFSRRSRSRWSPSTTFRPERSQERNSGYATCSRTRRARSTSD